LAKIFKTALANHVAQVASIPEYLDFLSESQVDENKRYDNYDRVMDIALEMLKTIIEITLYENSTIMKFAELTGRSDITNSQVVF
jgi:hypothetical protein